MKLEIEQAANGYVVKWWEDDVKHQMAFEETNTGDGEVECFARLLWFVKEHFGMSGSKYDQYRIRITTENEYADGVYPQREDS